MRFKESFPFLQKPGQRAFPVVGVFFISFVLTGLLRANSPFITLDDPFSSTPAGTTSFGGPTQLLGISGSNSVGTFADSNNNAESFLVNGPIYTILNAPLGVAYRTIVAGISGSTAFGTYGDSNGVNHAFLSDGVSYTTIDDRSPSAASGTTVIAGISGSQVVGNFMDTHANSHGFLFNGTNYTTVDDTNAAPGESTVIGISGANIVGTYIDSSTSNTYGFVTSDGVNDTPIYGPEGTNEGIDSINGVSGSSVTGTYTDTNTLNTFGFLTTDHVTYTPIYGPEGTNGGIDSINGVSGNIVAGNFTDALSVNHGFYFDGTNYTQLDDTDPIAASGTTMVQGISGSTIFGSFTGTDGNTYNFTYSIPGATYSTFNGPPDGTMAMAISGIEAAGSYQDIYGNTDAFFFDGTNYHTINITTASPSTTVIVGISGSNIAGTFTDPTSGNTCGFLSTNAGGSYSTLEGPLGTNGGGMRLTGSREAAWRELTRIPLPAMPTDLFSSKEPAILRFMDPRDRMRSTTVEDCQESAAFREESSLERTRTRTAATSTGLPMERTTARSRARWEPTEGLIRSMAFPEAVSWELIRRQTAARVIRTDS